MGKQSQKVNSIFLVVMMYSLFFLMCINASAQGPQKLRIDPSNAVGGSFSDFFDSVKYIPLETTRECLFGKIEQLAITDDYFIILDYDTNSILIFTREGKFHSKINGGSKNGAPVGIRYFALDKENREISFETGDNKRKVYDFDGKKIREEKDKFSDCHYLTKGRLVYLDQNIHGKNTSQQENFELVWLQSGQRYHTAFSTVGRNNLFAPGDLMSLARSAFYDTENDSTVSYCRSFDYNIYQLGTDTVLNKYCFILPLAITLPKDFGSKVYYGNRFSYLIKEHPETVYAISHFYRLNDVLFFKLESASSRSVNSFFYNLHSGNLVALTKVSSDSTNSFLPVFGYNGSATFSFSSANFLTIDSGYLYTAASALDMFSAKDATAYKGARYNAVLENYFKGTKNDNPVIIAVKPKANP